MSKDTPRREEESLMAANAKISVTNLIEKENLENLTPEIDTDSIFIETWEINRPALQLTGWYYDFDEGRIQVLGNVECSFINNIDDIHQARSVCDELTSHNLPCIIYANGNRPDVGMIAACHRNKVPLLVSPRITTSLIAELTRWLKVRLAPCVSVHGVLVDVYGVGVLITGDSGIGKSEVALELIRRGHRLVSDDVVEIRKVSDATLYGSAPALTRHLLELRGIGILNIKNMFGVESIKDTMNIDLVINLQEYDKEDNYDRLGLDEQSVTYLGIEVTCHTIPIRPGRNMAIIVEGAAINARAKYMGYNAAQELCDRMNAKIKETDGASDDSSMTQDISSYLQDVYGGKRTL